MTELTRPPLAAVTLSHAEGTRLHTSLPARLSFTCVAGRVPTWAHNGPQGPAGHGINPGTQPWAVSRGPVRTRSEMPKRSERPRKGLLLTGPLRCRGPSDPLLFLVGRLGSGNLQRRISKQGFSTANTNVHWNCTNTPAGLQQGEKVLQQTSY